MTHVTQQPAIRAVLFDLDGTLIDTAADFIRIIQDMCRENDVAVVDAAAIRAQVSEGARAMVRLVYPHLTVDDAQFLQLRDEFLRRYGAQIVVETALFDGMAEVLADLEQRGLPWGIVTNKPRALSEALLAALQLDQRCRVLVCPDDVTHSKPHPEPMLLAADQLHIEPHQIVYVGDHPRDIDAGRAANMPTLLAAYGYLPPDAPPLSAWGADRIVSSVAELRIALAQMPLAVDENVHITSVSPD